MTLDELLALLPDNTTGEISAADLRTVVSDLYDAAHSVTQVYAYRWTTSAVPTAGHVTMDQPWMNFASKVIVSETTDDGVVLGFGLIDSAAAARVWFTHNATGAKLTADITGPSVDLGNYREVPISVREIVGNPPGNNDPVTLSLLVVAG